MRVDLDRALCAKYPKFYGGDEVFGFECDDGWYDLIDRLSAQIEPLVPVDICYCGHSKALHGPDGKCRGEYPDGGELCDCVEYEAHDFYVVQIKQKFGTLRVYTSYYLAAVQAIIDTAERASASICEVCGGVGSRHVLHNWYHVTRCDAHAAEI